MPIAIGSLPDAPTEGQFAAPRRRCTEFEPREGCWQTNANSSLQGQDRCPLSGTKAAPLGKGGGSVQLENCTRGKAALLVEEIMDRGVNGGKQL